MSFNTATAAVNSGTVAGSPIGNTLTGPTTVDVQNAFEYSIATTTQTVAVALTIVAPTSPSGWTAQICPTVAAGVCSGTAANWGTTGAAGATSTTTYTIPANTAAGVHNFYVVYSAPAGVTAFSRYDATIIATTTVGANTYTNYTHNELYAGYVVLTKSVSVLTSNCSGAPPAGQVCPGGTLLYTVDYRNIMVGGASEKTLTPSPLLATSSTVNPLAISDSINNGTLLYALVGGANFTSTWGDSNAGSTFGGTGTAGSTSFTDKVGGSGFSLVAPGVTGTSQGTIEYQVKVN